MMLVNSLFSGLDIIPGQYLFIGLFGVITFIVPLFLSSDSEGSVISLCLNVLSSVDLFSEKGRDWGMFLSVFFPVSLGIS